jgi:hypothetical protein
MCRSIKTLRDREIIAEEPAIREAALQYVRKVSGFRRPSDRHSAAFESAVEEITASSSRLLEAIAREMGGRPGQGAGSGRRARPEAAS